MQYCNPFQCTVGAVRTSLAGSWYLYFYGRTLLLLLLLEVALFHILPLASYLLSFLPLISSCLEAIIASDFVRVYEYYSYTEQAGNRQFSTDFPGKVSTHTGNMHAHLWLITAAIINNFYITTTVLTTCLMYAYLVVETASP